MDVFQNELIKIEKFKGSLKITPIGNPKDISFVPYILSTTHELFSKGYSDLILDLRNVHVLLPSVIVLLYELTAKARRRGGNLQIVGMNQETLDNLLTFDPLSYLTVENDKSGLMKQDEDQKIMEKPKAESPSPPDMNTKENYIKIPSKVDALYRACNFVTDIARDMGFSESDIGKIKISVYEAALNVIEHAYHSDPTKFVKIAVKRHSSQIEIIVIDYGRGFIVNDKKEFNIIEASSNRKTGGMGLHIIKRSMDSIHYSKDPLEGNKLTMTKLLRQI